MANRLMRSLFPWFRDLCRRTFGYGGRIDTAKMVSAPLEDTPSKGQLESSPSGNDSAVAELDSPRSPPIPVSRPSARRSDLAPSIFHVEEVAQTDGNLIANELDTFSEFPRSFTFSELSDFADSEIARDDLRSALVNDSRFIGLEEGDSLERTFVPKKALFRWFSGLTMRLAQAKQSRLSGYQLAGLMSSLRVEGRWQVPPARALEFGQRVGFVGPAWTAGEYFFPLAHILSSVAPSLRIAASCLAGGRETEMIQGPLLEMLEEAVREGLSRFEKRVVHIIAAREGLASGRKLTLAELGDSLGLTRERVRQLEARFWTKISEHQPRDPQKALTWPFLFVLLRDIVAAGGSLIFTAGTREGYLRRFIAKCVGVPQAEVPGTRLAILGSTKEGIPTLELAGLSHNDIDADSIASRLDSTGKLHLLRSDLKALGQVLAESNLKKGLTRTQMAYLALRKIGRPAHYSQVAEVCNSMFPDRPTTENNIHAVLDRAQHGVVWIGVRGTYALKEWGYERPSKRLFDAVAEIVQERYTETSRPVPFTVITAEIGKYRQIVSPSSLTFAAHCNPCLRRVSKDAFVPIDPADEAQEEMSGAELDRILREFESEKSQ